MFGAIKRVFLIYNALHVYISFLILFFELFAIIVQINVRKNFVFTMCSKI